MYGAIYITCTATSHSYRNQSLMQVPSSTYVHVYVLRCVLHDIYVCTCTFIPSSDVSLLKLRSSSVRRGCGGGESSGLSYRYIYYRYTVEPLITLTPQHLQYNGQQPWYYSTVEPLYNSHLLTLAAVEGFHCSHICCSASVSVATDLQCTF